MIILGINLKWLLKIEIDLTLRVSPVNTTANSSQILVLLMESRPIPKAMYLAAF